MAELKKPNHTTGYQEKVHNECKNEAGKLELACQLR
jgi:hypothetical protein